MNKSSEGKGIKGIKIKEYANKLLLLFPLELAMWIAKEHYDKQRI